MKLASYRDRRTSLITGGILLFRSIFIGNRKQCDWVLLYPASPAPSNPFDHNQLSEENILRCGSPSCSSPSSDLLISPRIDSNQFLFAFYVFSHYINVTNVIWDRPATQGMQPVSQFKRRNHLANTQLLANWLRRFFCKAQDEEWKGGIWNWRTESKCVTVRTFETRE